MAVLKDLTVLGPTRFLQNIYGENITASGSVTAASIIKSGGTSSQFLKADGSIDSNTYVTASRKINNQALSADITLSLDNIADGSTRKLANYVPTTRKINNQALSADITLSLDNIADGSTRKLANYVTLTGAETVSGVKTFSNGLKSKELIIHGSTTANDTRFLSSSATNEIYASVSGTISLVVNNTEVRRGAAASTVDLGTSTYPWRVVYGQSLRATGGNAYIGSAANSQCHLQYNSTDNCLEFIFD